MTTRSAETSTSRLIANPRSPTLAAEPIETYQKPRYVSSNQPSARQEPKDDYLERLAADRRAADAKRAKDEHERRLKDEEYERELDQKAAKLREERKKRMEAEVRLMSDREQQIASLMTSTANLSRLLPTEAQSANVQAFVRAQALGFDVQSKYAKIKEKLHHNEQLEREIREEERVLDDEYLLKGNQSEIREELSSELHELKLEKERLERTLERKKEMVREARLAAGGGSEKTDVDFGVEKDLRGIDNLMMIKLLELKREKAKFDDLKNQYEEYLLAEEQRRTDIHRQEQSSTLATAKPSMLLPIISNELYKSELGYSQVSIGTTPVQLKSHFMPSVPTEVSQSPGSRFLDEFNRDLNRLICRE